MIVVYSTLFPNPILPLSGVFIRERMFRVGRHLPVMVVSPQAWFPLQGLFRRRYPHWRPDLPPCEFQDGFRILRPRFLSLPGVGRWLDGWSMALCSLPLMWRLKRTGACRVIDAHFSYPDGFAAGLLGRWIGVPTTVTLRGTEVSHARHAWRRRLLVAGLRRVTQVLSVSRSLVEHVEGLGFEPGRAIVIPNGVDTEMFRPMPKSDARRRLGIPEDSRVLVSVGGLVEGKGFHRVITELPGLLERHPRLLLLIVGGPTVAGDESERLRSLARELGVEQQVRFLGPVAPPELKWPLSAADVFVLATRSEGWANVFLEAMACGLPVVTTRVGGNPEVVTDPRLGTLVPFGDAAALLAALQEALERPWDREFIRSHAEANSWETRISGLVELFRTLVKTGGIEDSPTRENRGVS